MNKSMKVCVLGALAISLSACTAVQTALNKGAEVNDNLVRGSIIGLCEVYSVGSIKRKFNTQEEINGYNKLCGSTDLSILEPVTKE